MIDNIDNSTGETTPPLPKGFVAIKKQEAPPLPSGFVPIKKKESTDSNSTTIPQKSVSGTPTGSSGGVNPAFKSSIPSPIPDFNSVWKEKKSVEKPKTFRLPNESDEAEMQRRGITPPPSEMLKQTANNTKDLYDLDANGNVIPEKPNKLFAGLKKQDKTKGFYQQGEELVKQNKDIQNGFSEKTTFELEGGKLIPKTTVKDFKTSEGIDKEIENNDLNLDHPYLYYSTFDKENQPKDTFVESNFGENKLADLGINTADFDGFLNKKGYKAEFLDKEANGLFEGKGADLTGGYNIQLAKEIQKQRLLDLYMQDINSRDFAKRKLNQEKGNLGKLGADREQLNTQYTLFDSAKVGAFYEKEMPILTQKLKERDAENKKIYDAHKNGDAGFFYGTKQVLNSGWNGFLDRVNQTSSTMLDKIGLDSGADELRLLNEERQVQRPNTRDVGYASGRTTTYDGVDYLVTNDGQIIDKDKKIRVTDLFFKPTYDAIVNKSKSGAEDSVFSFQGSAIQAGGVLGDMIVQVALQRGFGLASGATVKAGSLLSKIPISKSIGSAIIAQSALGYSQGLEQTYKAAIDAGIDEKTAKVLATDAAQRMAVLYAVTAPISPQTKAVEGIFGYEGKELIKKAIAAYAQTGKKGFIETFKQGGKQLSKNAIIFTEEGGKEVFQENIQQGGENYGVNASINRDAGRELLKETISGDEFVNTSILSLASGGLMTLPGMFSSTDKLKTLQQLSKDPIEFEKNLKELVSKGVFTNDKADILRKDVKIYSNQSHKIPKNLNKDIAMDVMSDLEDISQLELKKKGIDKSFHEEIDAEIEAKRTGIRDRINFEGLSKKEIATLKETASDELVAEAKEQGKKEFKFDNKQITERANVIYAKQAKEAKKKENEQTPPTTEAKPQAEVPQQAEAEKVAEVSPVEDVVATSVEEKVYDDKNSSYQIDEKSYADVEKNKDSWTIAMIESGKKGNGTILVNKIIEEAKKNNVYKIEASAVGSSLTFFEGLGFKRTKSEITEGDNPIEFIIPNEATSSKDITPNASIRPTASNVGESGNSKQESPVQESVSSSVDGRANKGEVSVVFKDNKELQDIGSEEQYLEHLNAIFPDSKTKKTVYHGGSLNKNDKIKKTNFFNHFFFTSSKDYAASYSKDKSGEVQTAILNIKNLVNARTLLEAEGIEVTSANLLKVTNSNDVAKELMSEGYDGVYAEDADENTKELNFDEYVVFDPEQIHILGSKKDVEMFRQHVSKSNKVDGGEVKGDASVGKIIEPHSEVNTDVETVKKELNLSEVDNLIYDELKDTPKDKIINKIDKIKDDKLGEIEDIERKINDVELKMEDNGEAIDKIEEDETLTKDKKKKAVAEKEKEFKDLQKQQKELESQKEDVEKLIKDIDDDLFHPTEDYNIDKVVEVINRVNNRLETRKSVKEGTNLFPEDANIPEIVPAKKALPKNSAEEIESISPNQVKELDKKTKNNTTKVPEGKGSWRKAFNEEKDAFKKSAILRRVAEKTTSESDLIDIKEAAKGMPEESNIIYEVEKKLKIAKPTTQEKIAERIKLADAKVDNIRDAVKGIDSIFGIKIKVDDIEGLNKNGVDIVDVIANIAKQAIAAGIHIDEAINKTIEHLKKTLDFEVNIDEIKERINPKKEAENDFKSEQGKKSLINRIAEGTNEIYKTAIRDISLEYEVEKIEGAKSAAKEVFTKIGIEESIVALSDRNSSVQGAVRAFLFNEVKTNLAETINGLKEYDENSQKIFEQYDALNEALAKITDEMDMYGRDGGRFNNALRHIYEGSDGAYNLKKIIKHYEDSKGETIPDEVLQKYIAADKRIQELEKELFEAQAQRELEDAQRELDYITESLKNESKPSKTRKRRELSKTEKTDLKTLQNKYFGTLNDVTRVATLLLEPDFRKLLKLSYKRASGDFLNFSDDIINTLGNEARKYINELYIGAGGKEADISDYKNSPIKISDDGKISIPKSVLVGLIKEGYTDIEALSTKVHEIISEDFPDSRYTVREVRDAITNYGKIINATKDEVLKKLGEINRVGRLLSQIDDLKNGKYTKKDKIRKDNSKDFKVLEKSLMREVKTLLRENGIELDNYDLTEEEKLERAEESLSASIEKLEEQIKTGKIEYAVKKDKLSNERIKSLENKKQTLIKDRESLRKSTGLIDAKRLERAKEYRKKKTIEYKKRIVEKDFSTRVKEPLPADAELERLDDEMNTQKEIFEHDRYVDELEKEHKVKKYIKGALLGIKNIQRNLVATGEMSWVLVQNGIPTIETLVDDIRKIPAEIPKIPNPFKDFRKTMEYLRDNPSQTRKNLSQMFSAMSNEENSSRMRDDLKKLPYYATMRKVGMSLTEYDKKADTREEQYVGDIIAVALDTPGHILKYATKNKEYTPVGNKLMNIARKAIGSKEKIVAKKTALEQVKNINPQRSLERGMVNFSNLTRTIYFSRGAQLLENSGKSRITDIEDFKQMSHVTDNMTGRGNLYLGTKQVFGKKLGRDGYLIVDPTLGSLIMFSYKLASTHLNRFNPLWIYSLRDTTTPFYKPSIPQKMVMRSYANYFLFMGGLTMAYSMAISGQDDDDDDIYKTGYIETDPRSAQFMQVYQGKGVWINMFCGTLQAIPLVARQITGQTKNSKGAITNTGADHTATRLELLGRYAKNKLEPTTRDLVDYLGGTKKVDEKTGEEYTEVTPKDNPFGKEKFSLKDRMFGNIPMTWKTMSDMSELEGDRELYNNALYMSMLFGGSNAQVFDNKSDTPEQEFLKKQKENKEYNALPQEEKDKVDSNAKIPSLRGAITEQENMKYAIKTKTPYYVKGDSEPIDLSDITIAEIDETIADLKNSIEEMKKEAGDKYKEPKN